MTSVALNLSLALSNAFSAAQILLTSPPPIPSVCKFFATTIAFDFTNFTTFKAKIKSFSSWDVGLAFVTTSKSSYNLLFLG